jgi:N utilization substance protein A
VSDADGNKTATVVVQEDQLSLAIGRDGQNARLAAKLTGWRIDIKSITEAAGDSVQKLQTDAELSALMPNAVESIPSIEEILAKKAENRPLTPEEYTALAQFVDRVERRTIQIKEEAARAEEVAGAAHPDIPTAAFGMPLEQAGIKDHTFNILVEAGYDTVGSLMVALKADSNRVLGLAGIGPKAMQNIEEAFAAIQFPETLPAEVAADAPVEAASKPEAAEGTATPVEVSPAEKQAPTKKEARKVVEEEEDEHAKDGVSLDELFAMKPEISQAETMSLRIRRKARKSRRRASSWSWTKNAAKLWVARNTSAATTHLVKKSKFR